MRYSKKEDEILVRTRGRSIDEPEPEPEMIIPDNP